MSDNGNSATKRRVLFISFKNDYGDPRRGLSFEYVNFFQPMMRMQNIDATLFAFDEVLRQAGRSEMNRLLLETVEKTNPEVCFFTLFTDEIEQRTIRRISDRRGTITLNWFGDDHWRFDSFSRHWAPRFQWIVTTDAQAVERYRAIGCSNVIRSQWGFNPGIEKTGPGETEYPVTFIGQVHSGRRRAIEYLLLKGVDVRCWGRGWEFGRVNQQEMTRIVCTSRINLNFTGSSADWSWKPVAKILTTRRLDNSFHLNSLSTIKESVMTLFKKNRAQIKGRNFEIPGSGGFLLTEYVDGLEEYFVLDREIATFRTLDDLVAKCRYYLTHDAERETIREAGFRRAMRDHTFEKRLNDIFRMIGLW